MRRIAMQIGLVLALIAFALPARAIELITIERPFRAHHLAGVVVDSTGAPVSGVVVEECDALFTPIQVKGPEGKPVSWVAHGPCDRDPKHILASTKTDANGHLAFPQVKTGTTHYLIMRIDGWDPMQIAVQLRWIAKGNLRIKLHIAT